MTTISSFYHKRAHIVKSLAEKAVSEWEMKRKRPVAGKKEHRVHHCISFSRQIGSGAVEIAELAAQQLGMKVADRQILEHIAGSHDLRQKTIDYFDERYSGRMSELSSLLFGEKSFTMGDYQRYLAAAVYALAESAPTIFIGRASHLILPRDRVLAVRFIASLPYRVKLLSRFLDIPESAAETEIDIADSAQREFFRKNFGRPDALIEEFDLVINRDCMESPRLAAELVITAFKGKFGRPE